MKPSGGPGCRSVLPEILKPSTELAAAQGDNGIGSVQGPVHAGALEASADGHLAAGFDDAGGGAETLGVKLGVAHAVTVGLEVVESAAGVFTGGGMAAERRQQSVEAACVQFLMSAFDPCRGARVGGSVESFGQVAEVLLGVKAIDDLPGLGKQFVGDVPNPGCAIAQDHGTRHCGETAARGFAPDPLAKFRALRGGVGSGGALDGGGIGHRTFVARG